MILLARLGVLAVLLVLWSVTAAHMPQGLFASPSETLAAARGILAEGRLWKAIAASLQVYLSGTGLAAVVGIGLGLAMGAAPFFGRTIDVFLYALAATPRVAFVPLIIVLLGLGIQAKVFIVFLGAVMPIVLNTYAGVKAADRDLIEMARGAGAGQARIFAHVILPGAVPFLVTGLRIGATIGLINTVVAELYTAVSGLGGLLATYGASFRMPEYFVVVLTLSLIGVLVTEALRQLENRLTRWNSASGRRD
ncbi:ABC transporter permease [Paracoccus aminophilus]|uniref:ABC-type nitrate/sulfonate/bicarbonate transport system n=1 Tax=Paracoccus aminophilus JCM 7686 TaxID=1367847 RepID=S5XUN5_PARAH|nr:ABC transporter permease [Paracoccus aminophilus]AGT11214.1 ABC-type nitrate/sulfonate/bicarbonate transport system [Paracoccus aminophilus JCM 7686]